MQDATLQAINVGVFEPEEGAEHVTVVIVTGLALPLADPTTGQQVIVPDNQYRVPLQKTAAQALIDGLTKAIDKLPDPKPQSNIVVPGSMDDVERAARDLGRYTK